MRIKDIDATIDKIITPFNVGDYVRIKGENSRVKIIDIFTDPDDHKRYAEVVPDWNESPSMSRYVLYSKLESYK